MKKSLFVIGLILTASLTSCVIGKENGKMKLDVESKKASYGEFSVSPMDEHVTISKNEVVIAPAEEDVTYVISGYFKGQIITKTKDTILKLDNAYIENDGGVAAIKCNAKTEISVASGSENYIVSKGRSYSKLAALQGKRGLVIGGSGTLYVSGSVCHGVEAEEIKMKGSGVYYIQGTKNGSAITCETFTVEPDKTFRCYLLNSKNGLKADGKIDIKSGEYFIYDNEVALKTDDSEDEDGKHHSINLYGGTFHIFGNKTLYITEKDKYFADGAEFIEEL